MDRLQALLSRMEAAKTKGGKSMWHMVLADAVTTLMAHGNSLTRDDLIRFLEEKRAEHSDIPLMQEGYDEALARLR